MTFPLAANITDPTSMLAYTNSVTDNLACPLILAGIYLSILGFLLFREEIETKDAFVTAIIITLIPTMLFRTLKLVQDRHLIIALVIMVISVGWMFIAGGKGDTT